MRCRADGVEGNGPDGSWSKLQDKIIGVHLQRLPGLVGDEHFDQQVDPMG